MVLDTSVCIEITIEDSCLGQPFEIYKPGNVNQFQEYISNSFIESVRQEHKATKAWCSNIYIKGTNHQGKNEFECAISNGEGYQIQTIKL